MISKIDDEASKFLREDLRKGGTAAIKLSLINEIPSRLEREKPSHPPFKNEKKEPKIEEVVILTQMRRRGAPLSVLAAFLSPAQEMANAFTKEITVAQKRALRIRRFSPISPANGPGAWIFLATKGLTRRGRTQFHTSLRIVLSK